MGGSVAVVDPDQQIAARGEDGRRRCRWALGTPDYLAYHDDEWGRPVTGEDELFERLSLEAFQSGLSWLTILRKRENFRRAFADFSIERIAAFGPADFDRLMNDAGIVRNRLKIEAVMANAHAAAEMHARGESLSDLFWSHRPRGRPRAPRRWSDIAATTPESSALAKELKHRGFRFVGPTTVYASMQACGVVNDHAAGCWVRPEVERERRVHIGADA
jgi:DNA-3-methyladenine glycosylase I